MAHLLIDTSKRKVFALNPFLTRARGMCYSTSVTALKSLERSVDCMVFVLFYHRLAPKGESSTSLSECAC